jgi:hypothetical protein
MPGEGVKKMPYKPKPGDMGRGAIPMPYRPSEQPKSTPQDWIKGEREAQRKRNLERKREELAKKKADIIKGQNSQTAAGSDGARMESLRNIEPSNRSDRPKFRYL